MGKRPSVLRDWANRRLHLVVAGPDLDEDVIAPS